jgi:RND family efflux transporter MFP subunit
MRYLVAISLLVMAALTWGVEGAAGPFHVSLRTDPEIVPVGRARVIVRVTDRQGSPVTDATVRVFARMPGMDMGEREETAVPTPEAGVYTAPAIFAMAGGYEVTISVSKGDQAGQAVLRLTTGRSSVDRHDRPVWLFVLLGGAVLAGLILWRMRATGQRIHLKGALNRTVVLSLLMLVVAYGVATWAVRNLRREGAMTPLEAQVMEMNVPAPEGTLPVVLAEVQEEPFSESVTYAGQVVGYVEQDVVPRVAGAIVHMPVYVGDRVRRGQLLARLDTSQIDPMVAEKAAGLDGASRGVAVAESEYRQSLNMVEQSKAEAEMAAKEVTAARSMLESAEAGRAAAESATGAAEAELQSAQAGLDAAIADQTYQRQELERTRQLYDRGAVSTAEWQMAVATAARADAAVSSARAGLERASSMLAGARSEAARARAEVAAATARVSTAVASFRAREAQIRTAKSGAQSAKARIGQATTGVSEASARLRAATTERGYAELRAESDGVVTQRLVSPGVVVSPGQAVLRVVQASPVRIQANVPQRDLARVRPGDRVSVRAPGSAQKPLVLRVTSVSPAVDPASRMGVVEAVYANEGATLSPGQFVSLEIFVGPERRALVVPTESVLTDAHGPETVHHVWVATAGAAGRLTVTRRQIELAGQARGRTAVRAGLVAGERVVVSPFGLAEGMGVHEVQEPVDAVGDTVHIEVTEAGYSPGLIHIPAGRPVTLVFTLRAEGTCAAKVVFPALGVRIETQLDQQVAVEIPAQEAGTEVRFACSMDMFRGKVVAR